MRKSEKLVRFWVLVCLLTLGLFVFMGLVLQKTRLAEQLLESMGRLFGGVRGGIAISTVLVGSRIVLAPREVPQEIKSPGIRVMSLDIRLTTCCGEKIISLTG